MPMIIEYAAVAIGVAAIAGVLIWHKTQIQRRIRAIDSQLAKMQKEIDVLQMQESRRLMVELKANSRVESLQIDSDNGSAEIGGGEVVRLAKTPPTTPA
jgi:uncharacterized protein HemX